MKKSDALANLIRERIAKADYLLSEVSSERKLGEELGVSRNTVRAAVQSLVEQGVLARGSNGRLELPVNPTGPVRVRAIAFLTQSMLYAPDWELWRWAVSASLEGRAATFRHVVYGHWGDPAVQGALRGFDGCFIIPPTEPFPDWLYKKINESKAKVAILDQDQSAAGLPSVNMFPPESEVKLFDHLVKLGHRRIDCFNTQDEDPVIRDRIGAWQKYLSMHGLEGFCRSYPYRDPLKTGYEKMKQILSDGRSIAAAQFCTTGPAAIGAMRAIHEAGLEVGSDISVCCVNDEGMGRYMLKSLTALESPARPKYLTRVVDWMLNDDPWTGPLLIQPDDVPLFEGESTGPVRK